MLYNGFHIQMVGPLDRRGSMLEFERAEQGASIGLLHLLGLATQGAGSSLFTLLAPNAFKHFSFFLLREYRSKAEIASRHRDRI